MSLFDSIRGGGRIDFHFQKGLRAGLTAHRLGNNNTAGATNDFMEFLKDKRIRNEVELRKAIDEYAKEKKLSPATKNAYYKMMVEEDEEPEIPDDTENN